MIILATPLTPALARWLREARDNDAAPLTVYQSGADIVVRRADGSEPSVTEIIEIESLVAANAVEPLASRR